ncbi:FMN-dependent 2-nitropropane dioxygenase [Teratosphaeria destructans]|uniref:FMN-dependent 2-nitropropane dioxygenase n=1 Tax=Teratosphaeria destructans TaxID=418781 RepID=A0A9W7W0S5_9PEZI|nr:FMN-dependent 2-nitropropane dioxygenase [Teratosphaeria destructans]
MASQLVQDYPWTKAPLVACAPMRLIALSRLAFEVSHAGGLGFVGAGSDVSTLDAELAKVRQMCSSSSRLSPHSRVLPVGVGFLLWAGEGLLHDALPVLEKFRPAAVWLFAPSQPQQLVDWTEQTRHVTEGQTRIWVQIGTVADAVAVTETCRPDVLVVQGGDAGGHGLERCAGLVSLVPEVDDAVSAVCRDHAIQKPHLVAAGGIMDGRGAAAAVALGTQGVVMGTRYLASPEANIAQGYRDAVIQASDGGVSTERGKLYDTLRGTTDWPHRYGGRGVRNETWYDAAKGMSVEENKKLYEEALKRGDEGWGSNARLTTHAGTGVGLVKEVKGAAAITIEVRDGAHAVLKSLSSRLPQ